MVRIEVGFVFDAKRPIVLPFEKSPVLSEISTSKLFELLNVPKPLAKASKDTVTESFVHAVMDPVGSK